MNRSVYVPFIARWPGKIKAGTTSNQLICNVDVLSTFAALTGQQTNEAQGRDSVNVLDALVGDPELVKIAVFPLAVASLFSRPSLLLNRLFGS